MRRPLVRKSPRVQLRPTIVDADDSGSVVDGGMYFASEKTSYKFIHSGCTLLDCVVGGGWPLGRVINIVGDKSSGKTLLAMEAIANFFLMYPEGWVKYVEAEAAFESEYAEALGIPIERVDIEHEFDTVEQVFKDLESLTSTDPGLYIVDSLDALSDDNEMEDEIGKASYGAAKAKMMSQGFRKVCRKLKRQNVCVIVISQVRDAIGVTFGSKHRRSGGKALDFYASIVVWLHHMKILTRTIQKVERPTGVRIKAKCNKNKISQPFRECEFNIRFGYGIEDMEASLEWLKEVGSPITTKLLPRPSELREKVIKEWYEIESRFLPAEKKYSSAAET